MVTKSYNLYCIVSPALFNLFAEMIMREALDGFNGGFRIGGRPVSYTHLTLPTILRV